MLIEEPSGSGKYFAKKRFQKLRFKSYLRIVRLMSDILSSITELNYETKISTTLSVASMPSFPVVRASSLLARYRGTRERPGGAKRTREVVRLPRWRREGIRPRENIPLPERARDDS